MDKTDDFISNRLIWRAGRYNLPTQSSFYFKDLLSDIQQYLISNIDKRNSGEPVLYFTTPTKEWTLVCTRQVVCNNGREIFTIDIADIYDFKPTVFDNFQKGQLILYKSGNYDKREWNTVTVFDKRGERYVLHADKGADLFALWNILLMASRLID